MKAPSIIDNDSFVSESSESDQFDEGSALHEQENVPDFSKKKAYFQFVFERISIHVSSIGFMNEYFP